MSLTVPAEWAPHRAMWVGFPSHMARWGAHSAGTVKVMAIP